MINICLTCCATNDGIPKITEQEFPFYIEYSVNSKNFFIDDTVICKFNGLTENRGHKAPSTIRNWNQKLKSTNDDYSDILVIEEYQKKSLFKNRINDCSFVYLSLGRAEYYMGESDYKKTKTPCFYYYESFSNKNGTSSIECTVLTEAQLKEFFNIEIIQFSFSPPVENTFK